MYGHVFFRLFFLSYISPSLTLYPQSCTFTFLLGPAVSSALSFLFREDDVVEVVEDFDFFESVGFVAFFAGAFGLPLAAVLVVVVVVVLPFFGAAFFC